MRSLLLVLAISGCQTAPVEPVLPPNVRPVVPVTYTIVLPEPVAIVAQHDLSVLPGVATGVAIDGDRTLVLLQHGAIYDLETQLPVWEGTPTTDPYGYTDLATVRSGALAVTSMSLGFLLELETGSVASYFCYEPGWWDPGEVQDPVQLSLAVASDPEGGCLYAQPRTIENGGFGAAVESFVAAYDQEEGTDLTWWIMDVGFTASGMAVLPREDGKTEPQLLLGSGSMLHRFDVETGEIGAAIDLTSLGVLSIEGLALDEPAGTLLVIDGYQSTLFEIRLDALEL